MYTAGLALAIGLLFAAAPLTILTGNVIVRLGDAHLAIPLFEIVLNFHRKDAAAFGRARADAYRTLGFYQKSLTDLDTVVESYPGDAFARGMRADLLSYLKRNQEAQIDAQAIQALDPTMALIYQKRCFQAVYGRSDPTEIVRLANLALAIDPKLSKSYANRASAYLRMGDYTQAIEDATHGLALKPAQKSTIATLYSRRAEAYYAIDQLDKAISDTKAAIAAEDSTKRYRNLTLYYMDGHQYAEALKTIEVGRKRADQTDLVLGFLQWQIYRATADPRLEKVYKAKGFGAVKITEYFLDKTDPYLEGKNYKHALATCRYAMFATPKKVTSLLARGRVYLGLGRCNEALSADFNQSIKVRPKLGCAYYFRSLAEQELGQTESAKDDSARANELGFIPASGQYIHVMQDYLP